MENIKKIDIKIEGNEWQEALDKAFKEENTQEAQESQETSNDTQTNNTQDNTSSENSSDSQAQKKPELI